MTAYELADELQKFYDELDGSFGYLEQSINMLRQQADRIAELEKQQSAEPVAWMDYLEHSDVYDLNVSGRGIPLYTTPHHASDVKQIKELSDRELVVFLMDEIDRASEWLVDGETHMAIGVLGQCHAKIRKHLSNTKESE